MKKIRYSAILFPCIVALIAGCSVTSGNKSLKEENEFSVTQKILEGKTNKTQVRLMFGSPLLTSFTDGGLEIWKYENSKMSDDAVNYIPVANMFGSSSSGTKKELTILFDKNGVVNRYSMSESPVQVQSGLYK